MIQLPKLKKLPVKKWLIPIVSALVLLLISGATFFFKRDNKNQIDTPSTAVVNAGKANQITLPAPAYRSAVSLESVLKTRRSRRTFLDKSIDLKTASQLLWAAQGVTAEWGGRTTPSAKSTYPLTVYLVANKIDGLNPGVYEYIPGEREMVHALVPLREGNFGEAIFTSLNQNAFKNIPGILVITGDMAKMTQAFGGVSHDKEVYLEAGHAAQNVYLQAEALKVGVVANSGFTESIIRNIISTPEEETIIYLLPFGISKD